MKRPTGGIDRLHTRWIDFDGQLPPFLGGRIPDDFKLVTCNNLRNIDAETLVSTFVEDYYLERHWNRPELYARRFAACKAVMSPDYSVLLGMPEVMQRWQVYRSRLIGYIFARHGCNVIHTVTWGDGPTFGFCFEGLPEGCDVAVSSTGAVTERAIEHFEAGYSAMLEAVKPRTVLFQCAKKLRNRFAGQNVIFVSSHFEQRRSALKHLQNGRT